MDKTVPQITRGDTRFVIHVSEKLAFEDSCRNINQRLNNDNPKFMQEEEFKVW